MKKLVLLLAVLVFVFTACEGSDGFDKGNNETNSETPTIPKIELSQQNIEVGFEPAQHSITITSPYSWEATSKNNWIIVDTNSGIAGTKTLKFSVEHNKEMTIREGTIAIKNEDYDLAAELYVTQNSFAPKWDINPESLEFGADGGEKRISVVSNFEYEVEENADWLTITKADKNITLFATAYTEVESRSATVKLFNKKYDLCREVNVLQNAFAPLISTSTDYIYFYAEGGTHNIDVIANIDYEIENTAKWLSVNKRENELNITSAYSYMPAMRKAEIKLTNKKYSTTKVITIEQGAADVNSMIQYTSLNNAVVTPYNLNAFGSSIISNQYDGEYGTICFASNITTIGYRAFFSNYPLLSMVIPSTVAQIGDYAFYGCECLYDIKISSGVTYIGSYAFSQCHSLNEITIPDNVEYICEAAFSDCRSLHKVTIGKSVRRVGKYTFLACNKLASVYCIPSVPPKAEGQIFGNLTVDHKIYVPRNSVEAYKTAEYWSDYASYIEGYDF